MIDLFLIKLNGEYDDIGATPSIQNGLFLCDTDGETYTRGYSYKITDGSAERIDSVKDYKIKQAIYPTIQSVCEWLNNWFQPSKGSKTEDIQHFLSGGLLIKIINIPLDFCQITYIRSMNGIIVYDNPPADFDKNGMTYSQYPILLPVDVEAAISKMIYYDVYNRETADGLKSENIGNYSYSKEETTVGSLAYPAELVAGLEVNYKKIRFVQ